MSRRRALVGAGVVVLVAVAAIAVAIGQHASHRATRRAPAPTPAPAPSAAQAPGLPAPAGEVFGASVNRLFNDATATPAQVAAQLTALRATGATVARSDALWEAVEPAAPRAGVHRWVWTFDDTIAGALAAHDLTWLPIIDYTAPWAQSVPGQDHSPPRATGDYAAYARAFAARYGAGGTFWRVHPALSARPVTTFEIWNEPDNGEFWAPAPDAAGYARLYAAARAAIDAVDPAARVIVGGLTDPTAFVPAMVHAVPALAGHVDGVAVHPYGAPPVVLAKLRGARATLAALGMGAVPLYVTEFGWTTSPPGALDYVAAARRPGWVRGTLAALGHLDCGLAAAVLYTWVTPQRNPTDSQDWFGIVGPDPAPTADSAAFSAGLRDAAAPGRTLPCAG